MSRLDPPLAARLHQRANAARWHLSVAEFARRARAERGEDRCGRPAALERRSMALHLEDLALACGCERGDEAAWEHFVREHRPLLYRAATAIAGDDGRELADSLYAELFGLRERDGDAAVALPLLPWAQQPGHLAALGPGAAARRRDPQPSALRSVCPRRKAPPRRWPTQPAPDAEAERQAALVRDALGGGDGAAVRARPSPAGLVLSARHDARPDRPPLPGARGHGIAPPDAGRARHCVRTSKLNSSARDSAPARSTSASRRRRPTRVTRTSASCCPCEDVRKNTVDIRSKVEEQS